MLDPAVVGAVLATAYGLRVHVVRPLEAGADPQATTFRADTWSGPVVVKVQAPAAAARAATVARRLAVLVEPALLAPVRSRDGRDLVSVDDRWTLVVWPLRSGENGFDRHQPPAVLAELGRLLRRVHDLGADQLDVPVDDRAPRWRTAVRELLDHPPAGGDPILERLRVLLRDRGDRLRRVLDAAHRLAHRPAAGTVLCHGDLHAGNVLVAPDGRLTVLDWDTAVLAPRERDLMFPGAGIAQTWTSPEHVTAFRAGYGPYAVDEALIAYYRCERILEDVSIYARSVADPDSPSRLADIATLERQFLPGDVVDRAERSLAAL